VFRYVRRGRTWAMVGITALTAAGLGIAAVASAASHPPQHTHVVSLRRLGPDWKIPSHGGASATQGGSKLPMCQASWLGTSFWTSLPAMNFDLSGFT
jgi:hypothetical protein